MLPRLVQQGESCLIWEFLTPQKLSDDHNSKTKATSSYRLTRSTWWTMLNSKSRKMMPFFEFS